MSRLVLGLARELMPVRGLLLWIIGLLAAAVVATDGALRGNGLADYLAFVRLGPLLLLLRVVLVAARRQAEGWPERERLFQADRRLASAELIAPILVLAIGLLLAVIPPLCLPNLAGQSGWRAWERLAARPVASEAGPSWELVWQRPAEEGARLTLLPRSAEGIAAKIHLDAGASEPFLAPLGLATTLAIPAESTTILLTTPAGSPSWYPDLDTSRVEQGVWPTAYVVALLLVRTFLHYAVLLALLRALTRGLSVRPGLALLLVWAWGSLVAWNPGSRPLIPEGLSGAVVTAALALRLPWASLSDWHALGPLSSGGFYRGPGGASWLLLGLFLALAALSRRGTARG